MGFIHAFVSEWNNKELHTVLLHCYINATLLKYPRFSFFLVLYYLKIFIAQNKNWTLKISSWSSDVVYPPYHVLYNNNFDTSGLHHFCQIYQSNFIKYCFKNTHFTHLFPHIHSCCVNKTMEIFTLDMSG